MQNLPLCDVNLEICMENSTNKQPKYDFFYRYNLNSWWQEAFSDQERQYIEEKLSAFLAAGDNGDGQENKACEDGSVVGFLAHIANAFRRPPERPIANRILDKAETLIGNDTRVVDAHVLYDRMIEFAFSYRDPAISSLNRTIRACEYQILIAAEVASELAQNEPLPGHRGFRQLAMIREQEEDYRTVIYLCQQALQQGWSGDWQKRIDRCKKIMADRLLSQRWRRN